MTTSADSKNWIEVASVADVPELGSRIVVGGAMGPIALFKSGQGEIFALLDKCPHKGGPLSQGIVHDNHVTCPLHNWKIGLQDGEAVAPDHGCAHRYAVRVDNGTVYLDKNELKKGE